MNLAPKGTIWDIGFSGHGLYIIRKYNQQQYEFFDLQTRKLQIFPLKTDRMNDQAIMDIDFDTNLIDQLDKIEQVIFKETL